MYAHNLPGWDELEKAFKDAGYTIEIYLDNEPVVKKDGETLADFDTLPDHLIKAMAEFAITHKLI